MRKILGFYDYTVVLTYLGLVSAVVGIFQAIQGNTGMVFACQAVSLLCDTVDGTVARTRKNRTQKEKEFGVQIDSLCDLVSFGIFPMVLFFSAGLSTVGDLILECVFCLSCVIRLGYYNVLTMHPEDREGADFHGLPVPSLTMILPLLFYLARYFAAPVFQWTARVLILAAAVLYILSFRINKMSRAAYILWILLYGVPCLLLIFGC